MLKAYYDSIGVQTEENTEGAGRSDDASFNAIGVQTSGVAAGASRVKTAAQVTKWGGTQTAFDPCYHRACDTYPGNISDTVLDRAGTPPRTHCGHSPPAPRPPRSGRGRSRRRADHRELASFRAAHP